MTFLICKLNCEKLFSRYRSALFLLLVLVAGTGLASAQLSVPLTIQEALYPGAPTNGIDRNDDPVTVGVPLPDSAGINSINQLGLSGASVGQFRVLGRWPDGNIKWVLVDTQASLAAGTRNTSISLTTGTGNFGGANLAADNGSSISVNTGPAQFTIRKARFNLFDQVVVNGKTLVASGTSSGLVVTGPSTGTSCGTCTDPYLSSNDPNSTAVIEENGPARAVIKVDGSHVDAAGNTYMHYTVRMHFYRGQTDAKVEVILRNADETSNTAGDSNSAFKGFASYEARVTPALGGSRSFDIGSDSSTASGVFTGSESAYLYQAYSNNGEVDDWNAANCVAGTTNDRCVASYIARTPTTGGRYTYAQDGYQIVHGVNVLASGDHTKYPQGWADLSDGTGAGLEMGVYQLSGYWPKSLQFVNGGTEARVGLWPDQGLFVSGGGQPYYQAWPAYSIHDLYFNFHSSALAAPANDFLAFQHFLLARAPRTQYNSAGVFLYPLVDPVAEDNYYKANSIACCLFDVPLRVFRRFDWQGGGAGQQHEMRWSYLRNFLQRGLPGRYLFASDFYRMVVEKSFPRSDGFDWRTHPISQLNYLGQPDIASANVGLAMQNWIDGQHAHWYGMTDYYFVSGDETVKDQILDGVKDDFLNANTVVNNGKMWEARDVGERLMAIGRLYQFLLATNDPDANALPSIADNILNLQVFSELNVSGYGTGNPVPGGSQGISRTRGLQYGCCSTDTVGTLSGRVAAPFREAILEEGLWEVSQSLGPAWKNYNLTTDMAYGVSQWALHEGYGAPPGQTPTMMNSGFIYEIWPDQPNATSQYLLAPGNGQTTWFHFFLPAAYSGETTWEQKFTWFLQRSSSSSSLTNWAEYGSHMVQAVVDKILSPPTLQLVNVPVTVHNNGGGSYTLSWTVPKSAVSYRIKDYPGKSVVDWIGFNPATNTFIGNPATTWPWFAATDVSNPPLPAAAGSTQTFSVTGLDPSQNFNFAVKAYVSGGSSGTDTTPPTVSIVSPASGATVSGAISLTANATDNVAVAGVVFQVDGSQIGSPVTTYPYTVTVNTSSLSNGPHTFTAVATDTAGNRAQASVTVTVSNSGTSDTTPPTVAITSPLPGATVSGSITVNAKAADNVAVASVVFQVDGTPIGVPVVTAPYAASLNTAPLSNGAHTLTAIATDTSGNRSQTSITITVSNSSLGAVLSITSPAAGATVTGTVAIVVSTSKPVSAIQLQIDGGNFGSPLTSPPYSVNWNTTLVSNGSHTITASAVGSSSTSPVSITVLVENSGGSGGGGTGGGTGGGGSSGSGGLGRLATAAIDGNTRFTVDLQDLWSLSGCGSCSFQGSNDLIAGQTTEVLLRPATAAPIADQIVLREGTFQGTVMTVLSNQFTLQTYPGSVGPTSLTVMIGSGTQLMNFTGTVQAGQNVAVRGLLFKNGPTLVAKRMELLTSSTTTGGGGGGDTTPPTVSITSPASGATVSGTITVAATATDDVGVASVVFQLDGAQIGSRLTVAPYTLSLNTTLVSNGSHTLVAIATDLAGNSAQASATFTVSNGGGGGGDTTPPSVAITFPASGATVSGTITITANATDNVAVASVQFEVDAKPIGGPITTLPYATSLNTTSLGNGAHTLTAVAADTSGNSAQASVVVTVSNSGGGDTIPPTVAITSPASGATLSGAVTIAANATDYGTVASVQFLVDGTAVGSAVTTAPYRITWASTSVINGSHTLTAKATDLAGLSATSAPVTVNVSNSGTGLGFGTPGMTCPAAKWCQTWPLQGLPATPAVQRSWSRLLFDTKLGKALYMGGDNRGTVTFSSTWWTYGYSPTTVSSNSPWQAESTCGERGAPNVTASYNATVQLGSDVSSPTATTFNIAPSKCNTTLSCADPLNSACSVCRVNPPANFNTSGTPAEEPTMWIDDEELQYCAVDQNTASPTFGQVTVGVWNSATNSCTPSATQRGIRGTSAAAHTTAGGSAMTLFQGCPAPQGGASLHGGTQVAIPDHMPTRHPWRNMAYDSKRGWWWQMSGKPENFEFQDSWYYDPATGIYTEVPGTGAPGRTDGSLEYDAAHDVLVHYGGSHSGSDTDTTWIMCLNDTASQATLASYGCTSTKGTKDPAHPWLYVWNQVGSNPSAPISCSGTRWDGTNCSSTAGGANPGPGVRRTQAMVYDSADQKLVLFGGTDDFNGTFSGPVCNGPDNTTPPYTWSKANCPSEPNDVWMYDVPSRTWTQLTNSGEVPAPSNRPAIAYNSNQNYFALFEGPTPATGAAAGTFEQGFYTLTLDTVNRKANWTLTAVGTGGDPQPPVPFSQNANGTPNCHQAGNILFDRCDHALENLVYDPANRAFIYIDVDPPAGTSAVQTWQLPEASVGH